MGNCAMVRPVGDDPLDDVFSAHVVAGDDVLVLAQLLWHRVWIGTDVIRKDGG